MRMIRIAFLLFLTAFLSACNTTFEVGVERPTPLSVEAGATADRLLATAQTLQRENERLRAELAALARTPTPPPPELGRVAYVQGGDIWIKRLPDGSALRLTRDGRNSEPRWSASGRWLAFRKERSVVVEEECDLPKPQRTLCRESVWQRQLWVVEPDQGIAGLLNDGLTVAAFAWSPAEEQLAYADADGALRLAQASGGRSTKLAGGIGQGEVDRVAWSPDGHWISYEIARGQPAAAGYEQGIWKITPGAVPIPIYRIRERAAGALRLAGWSTTGDAVLFWLAEEGQGAEQGAGLYSVRADAEGDPIRFAQRAMRAETALLAVGQNATALVFGANRATWRDKQLTVVGKDGSGAPVNSGSAAIEPAWSADGAWLAYSAMPNRNDVELGESALPELMARRVWVAEATGANARPLTHDPAYRDEHPLWSADGTVILFARLDAQGRASLWMAPSGGEAVRVVDEITPAPDPLGAFGLISWEQYFDWTRGG